MGKVTGFLEFDRHEQRFAPVADRVRHFNEFLVPLDESILRQQGARCMDCGIPFCHTGCPVNNIIPDWNDLVYRDQWREASEVLHSTNNFPEFTGRICPAPCEEACTLNIDDVPVTIKTIECAIADRAWQEGWVVPDIPAARTGRRVAVVGSGPAGMACAQQLARAGHDVTLFEKNARPGGLLRYGIPDFKMEKHYIDRRVGPDGGGRRDLPHRGACRGGPGGGGAGPGLRRGRARGRVGEGARPAGRGTGLARRRIRDGFPAPAEPAHRRRAARRRRGDFRPRQARRGDRRRRYRLGLHRDVVPPGRGLGDAARDPSHAAGTARQGHHVAACGRCGCGRRRRRRRGRSATGASPPSAFRAPTGRSPPSTASGWTNECRKSREPGSI